MPERVNLNADENLVRTYGPLGYVSEDERKRIMEMNTFNRGYEIERLKKEIAEARKKQNVRRW